MADINLAYYLLQDNLITLIVFAALGTVAAVFLAFLYIIHE